LLFVRGNTEVEKQDTGKHDWAVFLSTDVNLEAAKVLEIYALRWAVEVYFKEKAIYVLLNGFYHQSDRIAEQFFQFI
jgi:hypothetical protein